MSYGPDRFIADLESLGYAAEKLVLTDGTVFAVVPGYEIQAGKFVGRIIGLGLQATADFPRSVHSAIHVRAEPQLYETTDTVPNVRNVTASALGTEWRYWSKNFGWNGEKSARRLMSQVNSIFENA